MIATGFEPVTVCLEGRCSIQLSYATDNFFISIWIGDRSDLGIGIFYPVKICNQYFLFVGVAGFEPATSASQTRRDNRATLHPENKNAERPGFEPGQHLRADRLAICSITTLAPLQNICYELRTSVSNADANVTFMYLQCNIFLALFYI